MLTDDTLPSLCPVMGTVVAVMRVSGPSDPVLVGGSFIGVSSFVNHNFSFVAFFRYNSGPETVTKELSIDELVGGE